MRDRLIYILKHNRLIQKLYVVIMSFVFKVWGAFLKTDDKLVLFVSFMGKNFNDSPKVLYDYMQSHPEYKGLSLRLGILNIRKTSRSLRR